MYAVHMHKELYSGVLHKCGGKRKTWHKRYMILRNDYCLYYYKDTAKGHLGVISLRDPHLKVRQGEKSDCSWPKAVTNVDCSLVIITAPRTYFMYADSRDEAEEWRRVLQTAHDLLRENAFKANKLVTRSSLVSIGSNSESSEGNSPKEEKKNGSPSKSNGITKGAEPVFLEESIDDVSLSMESGGMTAPQTVTNDALIPGVEAIYDLAHAEEAPPQLISQDACTERYEPMDSINRRDDDKPLPVYEQVESYSPDSPISASIKNQPLPSIPLVTQDSSRIYDDIVDKNQPLYEDVEDAGSSDRRFGQHRECVVEANNSGDEADIRARSRSPLPPLPPKDGDIPPLPPKDVDAPPVPLKDTNNPPISPRGTAIPPLPPKENGEETPPPQKEGKAVSSGLLVMKDERKSPPSPRKPSPSPRIPRDTSNTGKKLPPSPQHALVLGAVPPLPLKSPDSEQKKVTQAQPTLSAGSSAQSWQGEARSNRATELNAKASCLPELPRKSPDKERKADTSLINVLTEQWDSEAVYDEVEFEETQEVNTQGRECLSPFETGKGVVLFKRRQVHIAQLSEKDVRKRTESVQMQVEVTGDPVLSQTEKVLFAETLREVEHERLLASEERFRWERERMKLEEERRQFEEERRKLQEELDKTKYQLQNS